MVMPTTPKAPETVLLEYKLEALEKHLRETDAKVEALEEERNKAMRWGIGVLGAAVLGMGSWIFNFLTGHMK
jgi:hypothetical protein